MLMCVLDGIKTSRLSRTCTYIYTRSTCEERVKKRRGAAFGFACKGSVKSQSFNHNQSQSQS